MNLWFLERFRPGPSDHADAEPDPSPDLAPLDEATVFDLLSAERRRAVVRIVGSSSGAWELGDLTETVVCRLEDYDCGEDIPSDRRRAVYVTLYQTHIPTLADAGALATDTNVSMVRPTTGTRQLRAILRAVDGRVTDE